MNDLKKNYKSLRKRLTLTLSNDEKLGGLENVLFNEENGSFLIEEEAQIRVIYPNHIKEVCYYDYQWNDMRRYLSQADVNDLLEYYSHVEDLVINLKSFNIIEEQGKVILEKYNRSMIFDNKNSFIELMNEFYDFFKNPYKYQLVSFDSDSGSRVESLSKNFKHNKFEDFSSFFRKMNDLELLIIS